MKLSQLIAALLGLIICWTIGAYTLGGGAGYVGGIPFYSWGVLGGLLILTGSGFALWDARRTRRLLEQPVPDEPDAKQKAIENMIELRKKHDPSGPEYPHPIIQADRCIACQACVEACPHDVFAMSKSMGKTIATVKNRELCVEDTSCQVACPINPPVCLVINTIKPIPQRPTPRRSDEFMSEEVPACYLIGDVSGTPLIKNAANEGANVINFIARELEAAPPPVAEIDFDLAIIGIGPAGASAAVLATRRGLSFVGIEQGEVLATISSYPEGKYIHFKPDALEPRGGIDVTGEGAERERLLELWTNALLNCGITVNKNDGDSSRSSSACEQAAHVINENECCKDVKRADDGDYFVVQTHKTLTGEKATYKVRRVVLAIGERGSPKKLGVDGETLQVFDGAEPRDKVMYRLKKPDAFRGKRIMVVGGGNSAVEAAVSLVMRRRDERIERRPPAEMNDVRLIIRSDLKSDIKFGNKQQLYDCIDDKLIKVHYNTSVKEIRAGEVVLMDTATREVTETVPNDFVFALIGSDPPKDFLEQIGIKVARESAER